MGLFWDLYQQSQLSEHKDRSISLEQRVDQLEAELRDTRLLLREVISRLEQRLGNDLDRDGRVG